MYKPERLLAFSDGVIAIAITLLVLGLEVPSVHEVPDQGLKDYLLQSLHPLYGYVASFLLIGTYWLQHYVIHHHVRLVDRRFVALNGLFLFSVSFVPFPTGLQASYRKDELAMVLYAASQAFCGLSLLMLWLYATRKRRLVHPNLPQEVVTSMSWRIAMTPVIALMAMLVSFVNIEICRWMFLGIPLTYFSHRLVDEGAATLGDPTE
ncbi:MAG: TMEM175 family protein [Pirellulales bacterium]